jgi:hypothetical protein
MLRQSGWLRRAVKKLHSGMRSYQNARKSEASLSRSVLMARITTKISFDEGMDSPEPVVDEEDKSQAVDIQRQAEGFIAIAEESDE